MQQKLDRFILAVSAYRPTSDMLYCYCYMTLLSSEHTCLGGFSLSVTNTQRNWPKIYHLCPPNCRKYCIVRGFGEQRPPKIFGELWPTFLEQHPLKFLVNFGPHFRRAQILLTKYGCHRGATIYRQIFQFSMDLKHRNIMSPSVCNNSLLLKKNAYSRHYKHNPTPLCRFYLMMLMPLLSLIHI